MAPQLFDSEAYDMAFEREIERKRLAGDPLPLEG